jgi:hypothetical protein
MKVEAFSSGGGGASILEPELSATLFSSIALRGYIWALDPSQVVTPLVLLCHDQPIFAASHSANSI